MDEIPLMEIGLLNPRIRAEDELDRVLRRVELRKFSQEDIDLITLQVIDRYLAVVRKRHGLHRRHQRVESLDVERLWLGMMLTPGLTGELLIQRTQKALTIAQGDGLEAVIKHLQQQLEEHNIKEEIRKLQANKATQPRVKPPIKVLVEQIWKQRPDITGPELIDELESRKGNFETVSRVDKAYVYSRDKPIRLGTDDNQRTWRKTSHKTIKNWLSNLNNHTR